MAIGAFWLLSGEQDRDRMRLSLSRFAMAAGCSILETSANPYVIALGPESTATRRLNFAQAFNPLGTNIGVPAGGHTHPAQARGQPGRPLRAEPEQLHTIRAGQLGAVMGPYLAALVLVMIWMTIAFQSPPIREEFADEG